MKLWNRHGLPKDLVYTYIGRGTPWGNPFHVSETLPQGKAALKYRKTLANGLARRAPAAVKLVHDLSGVENIVCSCTPRPCHGDCFVEIWGLIQDHGGDVKRGIREWVKLNGYPYGYATDGIDHINIYTKGATDLGRSLSNLASLGVDIPDVGYFQTLEGYWYYLSTGSKYPELMKLNGFEAKKFGKDKPRVPREDFQEKICQAMWLKVQQHPDLKGLMINSSLPFTHYYTYGNDDVMTTYTPFEWIVQEWEYIRKRLQGRWIRCIIAGSREKYWKDMSEEEVYKLLCDTIQESGYEFDEVVCGCASGIDTLGARYAKEHGKRLKLFPATNEDWERYGKRAGIMRNIVMGDYTDRAVVLIRAASRGSSHMVQYMESLGKPVHAKHIA